MKKRHAVLLTAAAAFAAPLGAQTTGSLVFKGGPTDQTGSGLGSVATVLTIQNTGNESGCVGAGGTISGAGCNTTLYANNTVKTGASQTQLQPFTGTAQTFALFVNAAEPAGGTITLNSLTANFYSSMTGSAGPIYTASFTGPMPLTFTATGIGQQGYIFGLDCTGANAAGCTTLNSALAGGNIFIGVGASFSGAQGGPETINVGTMASTSTVPEPSSMALLGTGLVGIVPMVRRRRK